MSTYPRTHYEMSEADLRMILDACKSTPVMKIGSYCTPTPQENANAAWAALGVKMGFDSMTVQPIEGMGNRFFSAIPTETKTQRNERMIREADDRRQLEIDTTKCEIEKLQKRLGDLESMAKGVTQ